MVRDEAEQRERHHKNLKHLDPQYYLPLAETVGQKPTGHRKENERHGEQKSDNEDEPVASVQRQSHLHDHVSRKPAERVVAKRPLALGNDQRPKATRVR